MPASMDDVGRLLQSIGLRDFPYVAFGNPPWRLSDAARARAEGPAASSPVVTSAPVGEGSGVTLRRDDHGAVPRDAITQGVVAAGPPSNPAPIAPDRASTPVITIAALRQDDNVDPVERSRLASVPHDAEGEPLQRQEALVVPLVGRDQPELPELAEPPATAAVAAGSARASPLITTLAALTDPGMRRPATLRRGSSQPPPVPPTAASLRPSPSTTIERLRALCEAP